MASFVRISKRGPIWETSDGVMWGAQVPLESLEMYRTLPSHVQVEVVAQSSNALQGSVLCVVRAPTGFTPLVQEGGIVVDALVSLLEPICA